MNGDFDISFCNFLTIIIFKNTYDNYDPQSNWKLTLKSGNRGPYHIVKKMRYNYFHHLTKTKTGFVWIELAISIEIYLATLIKKTHLLTHLLNYRPGYLQNTISIQYHLPG